jgi:hypothetical protein
MGQLDPAAMHCTVRTVVHMLLLLPQGGKFGSFNVTGSGKARFVVLGQTCGVPRVKQAAGTVADVALTGIAGTV